MYTFGRQIHLDREQKGESQEWEQMGYWGIPYIAHLDNNIF